MTWRVVFLILVFGFGSGLVMNSSPAVATTAGEDCQIRREVVGELICLKRGNKLVWQPRKSQQLTFDTSMELSVGDQVSFTANSSSGLRVNVVSKTPGVCGIKSNLVFGLSVGNCQISLTQKGNRRYLSANELVVNVRILKQRNQANNPDQFSGFQLQFVYVLPLDRKDQQIDINGVVDNWIDEGQQFLISQLGVKFPVDVTQLGYDIRFHQSNYPAAELSEFIEGKPCAAGDNLIAVELGIDCLLPRNELLNQKYYVFLVDLPSFSGEYCGYAAVPGRLALVAVGSENNCAGKPYSGFSDWVVVMWLHEVFHGLGVKHLPANSCDLMQSWGTCPNLVIDPQRLHYVGSDNAGVDITKLPIWRIP